VVGHPERLGEGGDVLRLGAIARIICN